MASRDDYLEEYESAMRHRNLILSELAERDRLKESKQSTARIDARLRNAIQKFAVSVDSCVKLLKDNISNPSLHRLAQKELETRRAKVTDLENELAALDKQIRETQSVELTAGIGVNFKRDGQIGESDDTRNMTNQELKEARRQMYTKQIGLEEALLGTTENLLGNAKNIGDEVTIHNELLDAVEHNVEHQMTRMERTTIKMKELVYKTNDNCMMLCILILIVILVILIAV